ncbi:MAG: hypothetical protein HY355_06065 [Armatimonadetes bacterium]|nr:hypothetical protein [Armatimonadota bacterium]
MSPPSPSDPQAGLRQSWQVVHTIWLAELVVVVVLWIGLPMFLPRAVDPERSAGIIPLIFYAVGAAHVALAWWVKARAFAAARQRGAEMGLGGLPGIAGSALVVVNLVITPAILGLVTYLGFGDRTAQSVLSVMSLVGLALARPDLDQWEEVMKVARIDADRPARR